MKRLALVAAVSIATPAVAAPPAAVTANDSPAARLAGAALASGRAFATVASLSDHVGQRLTGSPAADRGVEWALAAMREMGLKNVHKEPVKVPRWLRGEESAELIAPSRLPLRATALGSSVGTPKDGLQATVVEVGSIDELKALGSGAKGKIVLFNKVMQRTRTGEGYGAVVPLRGHGAVEAAKLGAVAALIRSVGTGQYRLPHTGATKYEDKVQKIPFAAISAEDADLLHRLIASGESPTVKLRLGCHTDGEVMSSNVIGEVPGREKPDEVVVIGAHLDSWDLGQGAIDDGAGCAIALETGRLLMALGLQPRRTVRVVLYMNEENGLSGARAYAEQHKAELERHVAAIEADSGAGRPIGVSVVGGAPAVALVKRWAQPLMSWLPGEVKASEWGGADLIPLQSAGVPVLEVNQDMSSYFDWHHTAADTVDKIDPIDLALAAAAFATVTFGAAEDGERLPASTPPPRW